MTDEKKRRSAGFIGSALIHILIVLVVSFAGLFHFSSNAEDIVEVTFFGGGGGGGGNGVEAAVVNDADTAEENTSAEETEQDNNDAIWEASKDIPPSSPSKHKAAAAKSTGSSAGTGTGYGSGHGSGTGPGSGSGGGHGSGHGTGTGSGIGPGSGVTSSPAVPPRIIKSYQPPYPSAERNAGIEGTVVIRFLISTAGDVEDVSVISSSGNANLDNAAVAACYKWRFTAAKNSSGSPVRCYASIPITFKIRK